MYSLGGAHPLPTARYQTCRPRVCRSLIQIRGKTRFEGSLREVRVQRINGPDGKSQKPHAQHRRMGHPHLGTRQSLLCNDFDGLPERLQVLFLGPDVWTLEEGGFEPLRSVENPVNCEVVCLHESLQTSSKPDRSGNQAIFRSEYRRPGWRKRQSHEGEERSLATLGMTDTTACPLARLRNKE